MAWHFIHTWLVIANRPFSCKDQECDSMVQALNLISFISSCCLRMPSLLGCGASGCAIKFLISRQEGSITYQIEWPHKFMISTVGVKRCTCTVLWPPPNSTNGHLHVHYIEWPYKFLELNCALLKWPANHSWRAVHFASSHCLRCVLPKL